MSKDTATPMLDELEQGPWPSFVTHMKQAAAKSKMAKDLLGLLERSFQERIGHWKHGGIVGVMGYGGGVIGRYSDLAEEFPEVSQFHTMRVNHPAGWYYTSDALRKIADIWEEHGSGLTNFHGSTGDIILLGTTTDQLEPIFSKLTDAGFDLGGSGSDMRTPSCCLGQSRCEWACYDSMGLTYDLTMTYQDELHRPAFPYKFKVKCSACPLDCVAAQARADLSVIGTWRDEIQIDAEEVKNYADAGVEIERDVVYNCPTRCMEYDRDAKALKIDDENCVKCMHCIRAMPKALRPGKDRGATLLLGAKAPIVEGALLSSVLVPFVKIEEPFDEIKELIENIWDFWCENGRNRERVGEMIERIGLPTFLEGIGMDPKPEMVLHPRENPYVFYDLEENKKNGNGSGS